MGKLQVQKVKNGIMLSNGEKSRTLEWVNNSLLRIYEKKNSEELFQLHYRNEPVRVDVTEGADGVVAQFSDCELQIDGELTISIKKYGKPYFEEYAGEDTVVYEKDKEFDLAMLEGHKDAETLVDFKSQMNVRLFDDTDKLYGLGDKAAHLNRRDYEYISWNTDDPTQHNETYKSLYKSINYLLVNHHGNTWYGMFYPSSYKCVFNLGRYNKKFFYIGSKLGEYDYFLLIGNTPKEITKTYCEMVGACLFPPMKMLGCHQSRWSYTEAEMYEMRDKVKELGLPLDYIHMDIDYMDHYKVYTVSENYLHDLKGMSAEFAADGIWLIPIIDPAVKLEKGYGLYDTLTKKKGFARRHGRDYVNEVWPGRSKYPNYFDRATADYLTQVTKGFLEEYGLSGIWCDMNEPASFNGPLPDDVEFMADGKVHYHDEIHNLYGEAMSKCIAAAFTQENKRPAVITRAAFATTSPYTTSWNGDNQSLWPHLEASLPQVMTMNLCNFIVNGVDVGGYGNDTAKELLLRWVEANVFSPFFRNHSCKNSRYQEPYAFDEETLVIYRKFLQLRYDFLPYLYDALEAAHTEGLPMYRPLFFDYPEDERTKECNDEVLVGSSILLAPVVRQGEGSRIVYLPGGCCGLASARRPGDDVICEKADAPEENRKCMSCGSEGGENGKDTAVPEYWVNYFTGEIYEGGKEYIVQMPLSETGLFVRCGAIVPMFSGLKHINKAEIHELHLYLAPKAPAAEKQKGQGTGTAGQDAFPAAAGSIGIPGNELSMTAEGAGKPEGMSFMAAGNTGNSDGAPSDAQEYIHYEDDGETLDYQKGAYNRYRFVRSQNCLTVTTLHAGFPTTYRTLVIHDGEHEIRREFSGEMQIEL